MNIGFTIKTNKEQTNNITPLVPETFTNAICYGQTGSGKTSAFMLPNIENRIRLGHGLLIYDFKGNLHNQVKCLAGKYNQLNNVFEIGKSWGMNIDILKYSTPKTLEEMFLSISGRTEDSYWRNSAYSLFENIFFLLKDLLELTTLLSKFDKSIIKKDYEESQDLYYPYIKNIYKIVQSTSCLVNFFSNINSKIEFLDGVIEHVIIKYFTTKKQGNFNRMLKLKDNITNIYNSLGEYHNLAINNNEAGGKYGVLHVLNQTLLSISNKIYFNSDDFDIVANLQKGKIVIINLESFTRQMITFLNLSIYSRLIQEQSILINKNPVTIFIDEAQKVLSENSLPDVDICRENYFEFIMSTQDKSLLTKQIGKLNSYLLLRNVITQFSFKTVEPQEVDINTSNLKDFEYVDMIRNQQYIASPIFNNKKELFDVEYAYQKYNNIADCIEHKDNKLFILKYSAALEQENKVLLYYYTEDKIEVIFMNNDMSLIENYLSELTIGLIHKNRVITNKKEEAREEIDLDKMESLLKGM